MESPSVSLCEMCPFGKGKAGRGSQALGHSMIRNSSNQYNSTLHSYLMDKNLIYNVMLAIKWMLED